MVHLINESTAAAQSYRFDKTEDKLYVFQLFVINYCIASANPSCAVSYSSSYTQAVKKGDHSPY